jgi:SAM-dependent methyltransferase
MDNHIAQQTATRATLSEDWKRQKQQIDWMGAPGMANYVNSFVSGRPLSDGGHWANYVRDTHLQLLRDRLGRDLTVLSLGCGDGHIDAAMVKEFDWPVEEFTGLEFDEELRKEAQRNFDGLNLTSKFTFFDFNNPGFLPCQYDVVFCHHALHHAYELETTLNFIEQAMHAESLLIGSEYLGPTQFQVAPEVRQIIQLLYNALPNSLKIDLRNPDCSPPENIRFASAREVAEADPSESVRSSDLRSLLFARFETIEVRPMGGTILRWLLQYRAGNFSHGEPYHVCIASLLSLIERLCIENRVIQSDDILFVLKKHQAIC